MAAVRPLATFRVSARGTMLASTRESRDVVPLVSVYEKLPAPFVVTARPFNVAVSPLSGWPPFVAVTIPDTVYAAGEGVGFGVGVAAVGDPPQPPANSATTIRPFPISLLIQVLGTRDSRLNLSHQSMERVGRCG